jgi:hypothetical protein
MRTGRALTYLATGLVTALTTIQRMMWAIYGTPVSPLMYMAVAGSAVLLIAGGMAWFSRTSAARIALIAPVLLWIYYLPACLDTPWWAFLRAKPMTAALLACAPILLIASTFDAVISAQPN